MKIRKSCFLLFLLFVSLFSSKVNAQSKPRSVIPVQTLIELISVDADQSKVDSIIPACFELIASTHKLLGGEEYSKMLKYLCYYNCNGERKCDSELLQLNGKAVNICMQVEETFEAYKKAFIGANFKKGEPFEKYEAYYKDDMVFFVHIKQERGKKIYMVFLSKLSEPETTST